jgi:hypothetical protein
VKEKEKKKGKGKGEWKGKGERREKRKEQNGNWMIVKAIAYHSRLHPCFLFKAYKKASAKEADAS